MQTDTTTTKTSIGRRRVFVTETTVYPNAKSANGEPGESMSVHRACSDLQNHFWTPGAYLKATVR